MSWIPIDPLDYSPSGDDIDGFAKKYIQEIDAIYSLLNRLRKLDASGNNNISDAEAYQLKIDTSDSVNPKLLIRNGANSDWILLGKIATNFGYDPASIGAVSNKAGAKDISVGAAASRPITGEEGSMYFSFPDGELSYFTAGAWKTILTMDITKLLNFDKVVTKEMTSTTKAPGKIPVADGTGKLDADITGSAEKLSSIPLDKSAKADGRVLIYYSATNTFAFADPGTLPGGGSIVGVIAPRENLKPYGVGEMVYTSRLASGKFLTCVVAGTSGSEQPDYSSPTNGLIVDGGVSWRIDSMKGVNTQVSDSEVLNQNSGDILLQTGADSDDGGKYITLKLKNGSTYKKLYIEPDNRSLVESVGYGVISGLQVNPQSVPNMTVRVEFGVVHMPSGKRFEMATVPSITINPADNTGVRNDLIYISPTGTVSYAPGTLSAAAVAGRRTYTVTTNFAAGNTITIGAVVLTAGTQFAVGADIATTVQNIANALLANTTITNTYNVTSDAVSFTMTEKYAGGLNTPPVASYTGTGVINNGTATNSAVAVFTDPVCPSNAVSLAKVVVNPNDTAINAGDIADIRNFNSSVKTAVLNSTVDGGSYIASGMKMDFDGLNITVGAGKARINGNAIEIPSKSIAMNIRKASLVYLDSAGNIGKVDCADPVSFIDNNTIGLWKFNQTTAGASIPNSAVGLSTLAVPNDLVPHGGIASVDGWFDNALQLDGTTGYFIGSNSTNMPTGAAERELTICFNLNALPSGTAHLCGFGTTASNGAFFIAVDSNGQLCLSYATSYYNTGYYIDKLKKLSITFKYDGVKLYTYASGTPLGNPFTIALATGLSVLYVGNYAVQQSVYIPPMTVDYIELRNKMRSDVATATIANKMMFPCFYDKNGAVNPTVPSEYAAAYHEYLMQEATGTAVADSNATNALAGTATGTTIVDSDIFVGGKARKFNGTASDRISFGTFACTSKFSLLKVVNMNTAASGTQVLWSNRTSTSAGNIIYISGNNLLLQVNATSYTLYSNIPSGKAVMIAVSIDGTTATACVDKEVVVSTVAALVTTAATAYTGYDVAGSYLNAIVDYIMFGNFALTQADFAKYYTALMATGRRSILDDVIPANAISLGFVRTNGTKVIEKNDRWYKYGRREGAHGGNRREFLPWKYFNGSTNLKWDNPFGTCKYKAYAHWAQDSKGSNELRAFEYFDNAAGTGYGVMPSSAIAGYNDAQNITFKINTGGAALLNNVWQTSGYLGAYVECLEGVDAV